MFYVRPHTNTDYAVLPNIDLPAVGILDDEDRSCLDEIGELMVVKGANDRFGITLLHSHFAISEDELFVEQPRKDERSFTLRPLQQCTADSNELVPINLQFDMARQKNALRMIGLEFIDRQKLAGIASVSANDTKTLMDVRNILDRYNRLNRFGVGLLHDAIGMEETEVLLETCDFNTRTLLCVAAKRDDQSVYEGVETTWSWVVRPDTEKDPQVTRLAERECSRTCFSIHCGAGRVCERRCTRVCLTPEGGSHQSGGHDSDHRSR